MKKITIQKMYNPQAITDVYDLNYCLGVSMNNSLFFEEKALTLIRWLQSKFNNGIIVLGDQLHRYNEYINGETVYEKAILKGELLGNKFLEHIAPALSENSKIMRWSEFKNHEFFLTQNAKMHDYYDNNSAFRETILESCNDFIQRQQKRGISYPISYDMVIEYSKEYILEETAAFGVMNYLGYSAFVYPGQHLAITKKLAKGEFTDINSLLLGTTLIETKIHE